MYRRLPPGQGYSDGSYYGSITRDGMMLAEASHSSGSHVLRVWNLDEGRIVALLPMLGSGYTALQFSPSGRWPLAKTSYDELLTIDTRTWRVVQRTPARMFALSEDERVLLTLNGRFIKGFDFASGLPLFGWNMKTGIMRAWPPRFLAAP